ncbi:MAG: glycine--tRNA ligase subunit beta [Candidatus Schekmanbacteria bacterium]|nr:glycine--tRNA ligase subunit beta [Candidatus Schekmanbacteria bacterium]
MIQDILLEIGSEEIPSRFMPGALENLKNNALEIFKRNGIELEAGQVLTLGTARRLVLSITGVPEKQADRVNRHLGPPVKTAVDSQGNYTQAALGFAKSRNIEVKDLHVFPDPKGERIGYEETVPGQWVKDLLPQILVAVIQSLSFPKSMRWGSLNFNFARPIHWYLALFGQETIEFELAGIKSGNCSYGHRFLTPQTFCVERADLPLFKKMLRERFCILDQDERKQLIREQIDQALSKNSQALPDEELLEEVNYLVEYPVALCGSFAAEYLDLPSEVLINVMRQHQKYFAVADKSGRLANSFVVISNLPEKKAGLIVSGNERVLQARLSDAQFFYNEDRKIKLYDRVERLKGVVFQEKLGSYYDKQERVKSLFTAIAPGDEPALAASSIFKADLLTEMVQEFPKLQGIMGEQYSRLEGVSEEIAAAIREHYLPRFAGDELPKTMAGKLLSVADKIDSIIGCFGIGLIPSGSQDPYALRRQALGIINILLEQKKKLSLDFLIQSALTCLQPLITLPAQQIRQEVTEFFRQRLYHLLTGKGYRYDLVEAALGAGFSYPHLVELRSLALQNLVNDPNWEPLVIAFKRVARIIPKDLQLAPLRYDLFTEEPEKELYRQFNRRQKGICDLLQDEDYLPALKELAALRPAVDLFFDKVLVMCEDEAVRENRLSLLGTIAGMFAQVADFGKIVTQTG